MKDQDKTQEHLKEEGTTAPLREAVETWESIDPAVRTALEESVALVNAARAEGRINPVFTTERWKKKAAGLFGIFPK